MTPYDGMPWSIPYGKQNAIVILTAAEQFSYFNVSQNIYTSVLSWDANNSSGTISTTGYWISNNVRSPVTVLPGPVNLYVRKFYSSPYYRYEIYLSFGFPSASTAFLGRSIPETSAPVTAANFFDIYGYRDDNYVYLWNDSTAGIVGTATNTCLGYISHESVIPLSVFYSETSPDVPQPDVIPYIVRGRWKKGNPDDPGSGGGYSDEQETPTQPGDDEPPEGDSYGVGGGGDFDETSDDIEIDDIPNISALGTGLISLYAPTIQNLTNFSRYLWSDLLSVDTIKRAISDPMQAIISLHALPGATYGPDNIIGSPEHVYFAGVDSGVSMNKFLTQYLEFNCGYIDFVEYYGSALDYNPYTKVSLYLPYIGDVPLDTDEIMRHKIGVTYKIDVLTGNCVALVLVDESVHYQFAGNCATHFPISSANYSRTISAALGVVGAGLTFAGFAAGGAGLLASSIAGSKMSTAMSNVSKGVSGVSGPLIKEANSLKEFAGGANDVNNALQEAASIAYGAAGSSSLSSVMGGKISTYHASALTGNTGLLGQGTPYFTIIRPRQSLARDYNKMMGYPTNVHYTLNELNGFVKITGAVLENIPATADEIGEIYSALKTGVII